MSFTVGHLETASLTDLRREWQERYGTAPKLRSPDLLRRILAWRIQAQEQSGIDAPTRRLLRSGSRNMGPFLEPGTLLTREWEGREHRVEVAADGFLHAGKRWNSLSEIAREITGTRWNGPRFFGLRTAK